VLINNAHSCCDVDFWTKHLGNTEANERAELKQIRGVRADSLREALEEMQRQARINPRVINFMYHADFNPRLDEHLSPEERDRAFEIFEKERGIPTDAARIVMEHVKEGRKHWHVVWYRLDDNGRPFSDSLDATVAHHAAKTISYELGLEKVISPLTREPGTPRPKRAPKAWEMYRGDQSGLDTREVTADVTGLLQLCENDGKAFSQALETRGYIFARGDRITAGEPALMIIDLAGEDHHLPRRIEGMNAKQVNELMRHIDRASLPTIAEAKQQYGDRKLAALEADRATVRREIEWEEGLAKAGIAREEKEQRFIAPEDREKETRAAREKVKAEGRKEKHWPINLPQPERKSPELFGKAATEAGRDDRMKNLTGPAAQVWQAWQHSDNAKAYAAALDDKGISFARVTHDEAYRSNREADFAKEIKNRGQRLKEGEIVIITEARPEYRRNGELTERSRVYELDQSLAWKFVNRLDCTDKLQGIDATIKASDQRAQQRAADWEAIRLERATNTKSRPRPLPVRAIVTAAAKGPLIVAGKAPAVLKPVAMGLSIIGKPLEILGNLFEPPVLTPEQKRAGEIAAQERKADAREQIDLSNSIGQRAQERQQEEERDAARQREERERYGGGRER
jgi:hypothetical protein